MTDDTLGAQDNINTARAWIAGAMPRGIEGDAESAFHYLETASERLRANDVAWARQEVTDAIERLRAHIDRPHTDEERPALRKAIELLQQVLADLTDGQGSGP